MNAILFYMLVGGGLGTAAVYFYRPNSGSVRLKNMCGRGAFGGALLAGLLCIVSGCGINSTAMNESTANVKHITDAGFDVEVTQATQPVVVDCYATWCGPCRQLAPIVDNLASEYAGRIKFVKVNVDESPKISQKFQIQAIPTLLFFKNGRLADSSVGLLSKADLAGRLEGLMTTNLSSAATGK